jgi:ADP-ribose pyrophosphatase YjhB (NUDIX family)
VNASRQHDLVGVLVVDPAGTQVLLAREPEHGRWEVVSAHLEGRERPLSAVARTLRDATGLVPQHTLQPHLAILQDVYACPGRPEPVRHVEHVFAVVVDRLAPLGGDHPHRLEWFPVRALPEPLVPGLHLQVRAALRLLDAQQY